MDNQERERNRDQKIEHFLSRIIGVEFELQRIKISQLDVTTIRQVSRETANNPDYISGITETMRSDGYVSPVIAVQRGKETFEILDGIHRAISARNIETETIWAYLVLNATDDEIALIAASANVSLNGQGLSELERRHHFLDHVRRLCSNDLSRFTTKAWGSTSPFRRVAGVFAVSPGTARKWVAIESFKIRVGTLGLKLPPELGEARDVGARGDAWMLSVSSLTDEELQNYWRILTNATSRDIEKAARTLAHFTSSKKRTEKAQEILGKLIPSFREMSLSKADTDRREATQIRAHCAGLVKLNEKWAPLSEKYPDVLAALQSLTEALIARLYSSSHATEEERTAAAN